MKPFEQLNGTFEIDGLFQFEHKFRHEFHDAYVQLFIIHNEFQFEF